MLISRKMSPLEKPIAHVFTLWHSQTYLPYPKLSTLETLLTRWSPHEPSIPNITGIAEGTLERFDYMNLTQRGIADRYAPVGSGHTPMNHAP